MRLHAAFGLARGELALDVDLVAEPGETLALVGPNGAGKSTCLHAIAGLLAIERGTIRLGGELLDGGPGGACMPPEARGVGLVFQDHLLFPHLTARDNVAYGLRARGQPRDAARRVADAWLERVGLAAQRESRPAALSGGQAQRVALARALAAAPRLLLLDEPLAAVDASARVALRRELADHLRDVEGPRLLVVHDALDAFALADRIAVLEAGRVVQCGTVAEIVGRPGSRYVADLVGLNGFRGQARDGVVELTGGARLVAAGAPDGPVLLSVHPRAVALFRERPSGSPRNLWSAPVLGLEPSPGGVRVRLGGEIPLVAEVTTAAVRDLGLAPGSQVWVALKATEIGSSPA